MEDNRATKNRGKSPDSTGPETARTLISQLRKLAKRGAVHELRKATALLRKAFGLPSDSFRELLEAAETEGKRRDAALPADLRAIAEREKCDFELKRPHGHFGCVRLEEIETGRWRLLILDAGTTEEVCTADGAALAEAALRHIRSIEDALSRAAMFEQAFAAACRTYRAMIPDARQAPVNLLLLLCAFGKDLHRQLARGGIAPSPPLKRTEAAFLLARLLRSEQGQQRFGTHGASQHVTGDVSRHLSLPASPDPRRCSDATPIDLIVFKNQ